MPTVALIGPELFPIPPIRGGAAELFIDRTAHHFKHWRPVVICPDDPALPRQERRSQVSYYRLPFGRLKRWLYRRYNRCFPYYERQVALIIDKVQPQVLHVHNRPRLAAFLKERFPRRPVLLHMHNLATILGKRERPAPDQEIPVDAFLACSRFVLEQEKGRLGRAAKQHFVVYNGVDPEAFRPLWNQPGEVRRQRQRWHLYDEPTVLYVGKIRESKGVGLLLTAMAQVWRRLPRAALVLVGGTEFGRGRTARITPFLQQLRTDLAKAPGRVILTGFIPPADIPAAYLLGDIFVGPSQNDEGLGIVFLEASASGLPIIATPMGGIPEVVTDGVNGLLLARKDDPAELAEKILHLLQDGTLRQKLARQGRELVLANFTWHKISRHLEEIYEKFSCPESLGTKGYPYCVQH